MIAGLERGALAVVTGGARGIGLAVVRALAAEGVDVACLDVPVADVSAFEAVTRESGVRGTFVPVDVRDQAAVLDAVQQAAATGLVRYAVNCAGIDGLGASADVSAEAWSRVIDVDLTGLFYSCQAEHAVMREGGGAIVNIASMSGHIVNRGAEPHPAYSAAKAGVIHLSKALGVEWIADGVRVVSVSPGYVRTALTDRNPPELNALFASHTPIGRLAEVEEIAAPVVFLLSDAASYITATDVAIDGGYLAW